MNALVYTVTLIDAENPRLTFIAEAARASEVLLSFTNVRFVEEGENGAGEPVWGETGESTDELRVPLCNLDSVQVTKGGLA